MENKFTKFFAVFIFAIISTLTLQQYVGNNTIYSKEYEGSRIELHTAILTNTLPDGKNWEDLGANMTNVRIVTVYLADFLSNFVKSDVNRVYKTIDSISMILLLTVAFYYFKLFVSPVVSAVGLVYLSFSLISTYHFHYFHPWDRLSLLFWICLLFSLKKNNFIMIVIFSSIGMLIKYDMLFVPILYILINCKIDNFKSFDSYAIRSLVLLFVVLSIYKILKFVFPQINESFKADMFSYVYNLFTNNIKTLLKLNMRHPTVLVFFMPVLLSALNFKFYRDDRFVLWCFIFGLGMFSPYLLTAVFQEVRAQIPILILIMPSSLICFKNLINGEQKYVESQSCC